jgi:hypothetical protein
MRTGRLLRGCAQFKFEGEISIRFARIVPQSMQIRNLKIAALFVDCGCS